MLRATSCLAVLAALVLCGVGKPQTAHATIVYSVTDLGDLPGGEDMSHPMAVNSTGQVVGVSAAADGDRAFLWQNGVMTDLGVLTDGHSYSFAWDINDAGEIVGTSAVDGTVGGVLSRRPFLYSNGSMTVLTGFGDDYGEARGINNASEVVGISHYSHGAFLYSDGAMTDIGSLGGTPLYSDAYGINDFTQVVGGVNYVGHSDFNRGVLWENSTVTDLGDLLGGPESTYAYDINNAGQVVGNSAVPSSTHVGHAFVWENGVMTDLGVWPGTNSSLAEGINDSGLAVGTSFNHDPITNTGEDHRAFVWDSVNGMQDLNEMLDSSGAGWTLKGCRDINNTGQIVGWGINPDGSQQRGFLLTVIPEPSTLVLLSMGAVGVLGFVLRRRKQSLVMLVGLLLVFGSIAQPEGAHASVIYSVRDLGDLPGGEDDSTAKAVNSTGQVVGLSEAAGGTRAFLWEEGVMTDLGVLRPEHNYSAALDINDAGGIVGQSYAYEDPLTCRPFFYCARTMVDLGSFGGGYGIADGINNAGQIVGISRYSNGVTHAFLYSEGGMIDLGNLEGGTYGYSRAYGINDACQITGVSTLNDVNRGFIWEEGIMTDLGDLPGMDYTRAYAINSLGEVVGESSVARPWLARAFLYQDSVMTDLGLLPATNSSYALGINHNGLVVGASFIRTTTEDGSLWDHDYRPFLWDSLNGMQNLDSMLDSSGAGWTLSGCTDINNAGQIVGWGINPDGARHGFLLTVIPEPSTFVLLSMGLVALLAYACRKRGWC